MKKIMTVIAIGATINMTQSTSAQCSEIESTQMTTQTASPQNIKKEIEMRILKFEEILDMSEDLIKKLPDKKWEGILAITRGGLVPAGILAQYMDIRRIEVINVKSYEEKSQGQMEILNSPTVLHGGENWLVIDDLSDTGTTLRAVRKLYPHAFFATLVVKPKGKDAVDFYSAEFPQDLWLHYPWEPLENKDSTSLVRIAEKK